MSTFNAQLISKLPAITHVSGPPFDVWVLLETLCDTRPSVAEIESFVFAIDINDRRLGEGVSPPMSLVAIGAHEVSVGYNSEIVKYAGIRFCRTGIFRLGVSIYHIRNSQRIDYGHLLLGSDEHRIEVRDNCHENRDPGSIER